MSGCYRCGSEDGNDAQLCPACTMARMQERTQEKRELFRPLDVRRATSGTAGGPTLSARRKGSLIWLVAFAVLFGLEVFRFTRGFNVSSLPSFGSSDLSMEKILELCRANPPEVHSAPNGKPCEYIQQVCLKSPEASRCRDVKEEIRMWSLVTTASP